MPSAKLVLGDPALCHCLAAEKDRSHADMVATSTDTTPNL
jgi:hypothetical protein